MTVTALAALMLGAAALQEGVYLDVPFVRQSPRHCGAAALAMTLRYAEYEIDHRALAKATNGASGADLEILARAHGFSTRTFAGTDEQLGELLRLGRPVIVALAPSVRLAPNHFVVVVGMTAREWIVHDPAAGPYRRIGRSTFAARWRRLNNWSLLIEGRGTTRVVTESRPVVAAQPFWDLASERFRQQRYSEAASAVRDGLAIAPSDAYGHEFLATLLHLEGRTTEALHHWNAAGAPIVRSIEYRVGDHDTAAMLARLHGINEGERLTREQWIDGRWLQTRLLPRQFAAWRLLPADGDNWTLQIESVGATTGTWRTWLVRNTLSALAERRLDAAWQKPFVTGHTDRLRVNAGLRDQIWATNGGRERLRSAELSVAYDYFMPSRRLVSTHAGLLRHTHGSYAVSGAALQQTVSLNVADSLRAQWDLMGEVLLPLGSHTRAAQRAVASVSLRWQRPAAAAAMRLSAGSAGNAPPDRQFSPLLRAHPFGLGEARRGTFVGLNAEADRRVFRAAWVEVRALVFADHAVARRHHLDAGAGLRLRAGAESIDLLAGRDMRTGAIRVWTGLSRSF